MVAGVDLVTHQQFVDNTILFGDASLHEAHIIRKSLDIFCIASGQQVNWSKSNIFFFNMDLRKQREIVRILGVNIGNLSGRFLGTPLFGGSNRTGLWHRLMDNYVNKLEGWKSKWLTLVGRLMLLKLVLLEMPIYSMMCLKVQRKLLKASISSCESFSRTTRVSRIRFH